jgi:tRNA(Leu) C34 or U34 (ribose-2'-O)-methylase TrmL
MSGLIVVLEQPQDDVKLGPILNLLGDGKLYLIRGTKAMKQAILKTAPKWVEVRYFDSTVACLEHLNKRGVESWAAISSTDGCEVDVTQPRKLALWFGNEVYGLSKEALQKCTRCIALPKCIPCAGMFAACCLREMVEKRRATPFVAPPSKL